MNFRTTQALTKFFDRHRIVVWYDAKQELSNDSEELLLPSIEKLDPRFGCRGGVNHA